MEAASTTSSAASSVDGRSGALAGTGTDYLNLGMFSTAQSDILGVGAGGFSINGFGNTTDSATQAATNQGTSFDLSEFPNLGGSGGANASSVSGNGLAATLRQQQQQQQQQQQMLAHQQMLANSSKQHQTSNLYRLAMSGSAANNFNLDDFPALGGGGGVQNSGVGSVSALLSSSSAPSRTQPTVPGMYGIVAAATASDLENSTGASQFSGIGAETGQSVLLGGVGLGGLGSLRGLPQASLTGSMSRSISSATPLPAVVGTGTGSASAAGNALTGDYGLLGLLGVIRMTDADRNALALGSDLTLLGLNLGSAEQIYSTFSSPWSDNDVVSKEPHYQVSEVIVTHGGIGCSHRSLTVNSALSCSFLCATTCNHRR